MKNQEREDCGLYLGMEFYVSGIETEWWCWSCLQDLLALIGAGVAQYPNKYIIHMTNSSFCLILSSPTWSTYMEMLVKPSSHSLRNDWFCSYTCLSFSTKEEGLQGKMLQRATNQSENPCKTFCKGTEWNIFLFS